MPIKNATSMKYEEVHTKYQDTTFDPNQLWHYFDTSQEREEKIWHQYIVYLLIFIKCAISNYP